MKQIFTLGLIMGLSLALHAQDLEKRHSFAKAYFGIDMLFTPDYGSSTFLNAEGQTTSFERSGFLTPAFNFGGTHFWGYADFFVSITTSPLSLGEDAVPHSTRYGAQTGFRIYPFPLRDHQLRPYAGYKFSPIRYRQETPTGEKYQITQTRSAFDLGLGYRRPGLYAYLSYNRLLNPNLDIHISRDNTASTRLPDHFFSLGLNLMLETTAGSFTPAAQKMNALLNERSQLGLFFGVGPSSAFPTQDSPYHEENYPFLDQRAMPAIFPDFVLGYHFSRPDIVLATSFRPIRQRREAYSFEQTLRRNSLVLEGYKFLFDYHGFAPFLGLGMSWESLRLQERDGETAITDIRQQLATPSIVFGWDIRPGKKGDYWMLRTNLRYSPWLQFEHRGAAISLQQLEFNFIQFVYYPQRARKQREFAAN